MSTPVDIYVQETQTGRFMFGVGVNSDAGVTGQIVIDERNFDITRFPTSWRDFVEGTAFRGAGQGFRIEAMPGTQVQRYLVSFTEPYLFDTPDQPEPERLPVRPPLLRLGRAAHRRPRGAGLSPDARPVGQRCAAGGERRDQRIRAVGRCPQLTRVLGNNDLYSGRLTLTHDTRDIPFAPTEGHLIELSFEQAFGDYGFPRGDVDYRKYFLVRERPDGSGRHTLGYMLPAWASPARDTPIFENYFAGGYSTLRGFDFRGASPVVDTACGSAVSSSSWARSSTCSR